jgi:hypothetical protein
VVHPSGHSIRLGHHLCFGHSGVAVLTHVLAATRDLNRLELVGETLRATLNALATVAPQWLRERVPPDFLELSLRWLPSEKFSDPMETIGSGSHSIGYEWCFVRRSEPGRPPPAKGRRR